VKATVLVLGFVVVTGCNPSPFPPGARIDGTWGGNNAGLIADDTSAHVHIGCTYGEVHQSIVLDMSSRFDVAGEQNITAHPVDLGILHPARFTGSIDGRTMTLRVTLTDTAVTLGPVVLRFEKEPVMGPCPICFGKRGRARSVQLTHPRSDQEK
jgi:hypothetical protein